jgi:hypothetical protein
MQKKKPSSGENNETQCIAAETTQISTSVSRWEVIKQLDRSIALLVNIYVFMIDIAMHR